MIATTPLKLESATSMGLVAGLISCLIAGAVIWRIDQSSIEAAKSQASVDVAEHANSVQVAVDRALSATYALGAMVKQSRGQIRDFNAVAEKLLPYYPGVQSLQLAPDGIVSQIYPLAGNERAIGHNLFADPQRSKESLLAKDSGLLTLAGPFNLIQGGMGAAGRLPVYLKANGKGQEAFWGFAIALIRFPDVLRETNLNRLKAHDHQYRLWKTDLYTGQPQIIASSGSADVAMLDPVEYPLTTPNGTWHLSVFATHGWRNHEQLSFNILIGALISLMIGWMSRQMTELRNNRLNLSKMVEERTTELSNEVAQRKLAQSIAATEALRLATILETASDGIHILNDDGILVEANKTFLRMLGYDATVIGKLHVNDWDDQNDWLTIKERNNQLITSGGVSVFETRHRRSDGQVIDVEISAAGIKVEGDRYLYAASRDITKRKQDEAQRNELLERLQRISAQVPGVIYQYLLRPDGTSCFPFASKAIENIYRVRPSDVKEDASKVFANLHPDDFAKVAHSIQISAREMTLWHAEYRVKFADGTVRWLLGNAAPQPEPDGSVLWHGFITDITERKQVEHQLIDSEIRQRTLIQAIPDLVWLKDVQGVYLSCNPRFEQFFGVPEERIIGKTDYDFVDKDLADSFRRNDRAAIVSVGAIKNEEWVTFASDGHRELLETTKTPIHNAHGEVIGVLGIGHDITERNRNELALIESESRFREIFNSVNDGIFIHDAQSGRILDVNRSMCEMYGLSYEQALACSPFGLGFDKEPYSAANGMQKIQLARTEGAQSFDWLARGSDGHAFWTSVSLKLAIIGSQERVLAVVRDVSQRKEAEVKLQLAASVFEHAREGITITNSQGTIVDVNEAFTRVTGYSRDEAIGQNSRILNSGRQDKPFYKNMWSSLTMHGHWSGEIWNRRKNGEVYAQLLTISAMRDAQGNTQQYVALFSDISAIKEHQNQLEQLAHFDPLTHLPNRLLLADRLQQAMAQTQRRGQQLAVAYLDLDGFKNVNDRHGHDVGDHLLIAVATAMKKTLREGDTLARIGGDEFVAVLIDLDSVESCVPMLIRLVEAAAAPVQLGSLSLQGSASVGVTFYPQSVDMEADQLLRQADQAMYQAKLTGKNRFHIFDAVHDNNIRSHNESVERIRMALAQREFMLYYQPKVNMRSGKVIGCEALIRWQHPEKGLLTPAVFLPLIEDHSLAVDVGEWVIDSALTQIEVWHEAGLDLPVSVNVGARQLQQGNFVKRLQSLLAKHPRVNPSNLELEMLETSALADLAQMSQVIEDCAKIGVRFALDDFGTGYSSLTYLKRLHVAVLKIDQSFVRGMLEDPDDLAILNAVIGLASAFKHQVVAEGVETVAHGTALLHLGCELAQGFGIARPMPAEQIPDWATDWQPDAAWSELPWLGAEEQL